MISSKKNNILQGGYILGHKVSGSEPRTRYNKLPELYKVVIGPVPPNISDEYIKKELQTSEAKRLLRRQENALIPTATVMLTYLDKQSIPKEVTLDSYTYTIKPYIPNAIRCTNCIV